MDPAFLVDRFVNLFEVTGNEESLREQLPDGDHHPEPAESGHDFRADVEVWLAAALRRRSVTSSQES